ncbi:peroxidase-like [Diabrotica virgifera virgifera]|uniref:Peroxidase-like n=1 Tax=Diabrotica virgifera virgifera TaxID=50390 RepID=A0A6P7G8I9_DIAVI|nr:peroxidase-like [Diabrotica virgifera virgifera]
MCFRMLLSTYFLFWIHCFLYINIAFGDNQECGVQVTKCEDNDKYRSIDGTCNNKKHPSWGTAGSTYIRMLPPNYGDGQHSLPQTPDKQPLPNARNITALIYTDGLLETCEEVTLNAMAFGQAVAHDLSFMAPANATELQCCSEYYRNVENTPKECANIDVSPEDPYYSEVGITCIPVVRTSTNRDAHCQENLEYAEQITSVTASLDLSIVYGSTNKIHQTLRAFKNGLLLTETRNGQEWPPSAHRSGCPLLLKHENTCYRSGDPRTNQNPHLTATTILWIREHNRIATGLCTLNPMWDDEKIFQTARAINIAQWQHITYYELLPVYAGYQALVQHEIIYDIKTYFNQYVDDYDENVRPHIYNEFAHGTLRQFHSLIAGKMGLFNEKGCQYDSLILRDHLDRPVALEKANVFDGLVRGMALQASMPSDIYYDSDFTRRMFLRFLLFGQDTKSIDIQRSRDHGLPTYNDMRVECGLKRATKFEDFLDVMTEERLAELKLFYKCVDEVEFILGLAAETNVEGTLAGPTALCVMYRQFKAVRQADRFWYENESAGFTLPQLRQIRKSNVARILCDNTKDIIQIQPKAFLEPSIGNLRILCAFIAGPNLNSWKE